MGFVTCRHVGEALINWLETNTTTNIETVRELVRLMDLGDHRLVAITRAGPASSVVNFTVNDPNDPLTPPIVIPFDFGDLIDDAVSDGITIPWDEICQAAETITTTEGQMFLTCGPNGVKKVSPSLLLVDVPLTIEDLGTQCGVAQQLVAVADPDNPGRFKLARYNPATTQIAQVGSDSALGATHTQLLPAAPENTASYYDYTELSADAAANTIDEVRLNATKFIDATITVECDGSHDFNFVSLTQFAPSANGGNGASSRVVLRIDDDFRLSPIDLILDSFTPFTNFVAAIDQTRRGTLTAGQHRIRAYVVAALAGQAAQLRLSSQPVTGGVSRSNTLTISKAVG